MVCFFAVLVSVMSAFHVTDRDQLGMMRACGAATTPCSLRVQLTRVPHGIRIAGSAVSGAKGV